MKVIIIGDVHLGAGYGFGRSDPETGLNSRLVDYENTLANIITYAITHKFELCIFVGDIFETRNPSPQQIVVFYRQLKRLSDAGITAYVIMGNHDYLKSRRITSSLDPLKELHIPGVSVFTHTTMMPFTDSHGERLNVALMPYRNRQGYDKETNEEAIMEMGRELHVAMTHATPDAPMLLCGHMMLEDTIPADAGDNALNELVLPFAMFKGFDMVINGHIHRPSVLKEEPPFIYSGSMECKDFSEREHQKCFLIYDSSKKGVDAVEFVNIPTRKFVDFEWDFSTYVSKDIMGEILEQIDGTAIKDAVVKIQIRVHETKIADIDMSIIRAKLHEHDVNCISDISVSPVILRQLRNESITNSTDDISAFKNYITSQTNVGEEVMSIGLAIMMAELEG